jgi:hypothetical protein
LKSNESYEEKYKSSRTSILQRKLLCEISTTVLLNNQYVSDWVILPKNVLVLLDEIDHILLCNYEINIARGESLISAEAMVD